MSVHPDHRRRLQRYFRGSADDTPRRLLAIVRDLARAAESDDPRGLLRAVREVQVTDLPAVSLVMATLVSASYVDTILDPASAAHAPDADPTDVVAFCVGVAADAWLLEVGTVYSRSRALDVVDCRHAACWLASRAGTGFATIGRQLGLDRSTVMHAVNRVNRSNWLLAKAEPLLPAVLPKRHPAGERAA